MSRNLFTIKKAISQRSLNDWFKIKGFKPVDFEKGKFGILTYWLGQPLYFSLKENQGYTTFIKQAFGGSLLVFEIKRTESELDCQCYSPIMLFGYKRIELSFQEKAMWITKYRKEGYHIMKEFEEFVSTIYHQHS